MHYLEIHLQEFFPTEEKRKKKSHPVKGRKNKQKQFENSYMGGKESLRHSSGNE